MYKKLLTMMAALALLGMGSGQATANTISLAQINPIITGGNPALTVDVVGDFTTETDGGSFTLNWDPTVLQYTGTVVANPPWDLSTVDDTSAASGFITFIEVANSAISTGVNGLFDVASISFNVVGANGSFSVISMANDLGWFATGTSAPIAVTYVDGQVTVSPVPVPAAAWLMLSGLIGLVGVARRRA